MSGDDSAELAVLPTTTMVLDAKALQIFNVQVTPYIDASPGTHVLKAKVSVGDTITKEVPFTISIVAAEEAGTGMLRQVLEGVLVLLVIVLVIIGLALAFRKQESKGMNELQTYY